MSRQTNSRADIEYDTLGNRCGGEYFLGMQSGKDCGGIKIAKYDQMTKCQMDRHNWSER